MLGRFLSSFAYFIHSKGCPALCLVVEAVPLVCHTISGSQGCLAWEKLHGPVPKSALHALLFWLSLIRANTMKTTATASFLKPPPSTRLFGDSLFFFLGGFIKINRFSPASVSDIRTVKGCLLSDAKALLPFVNCQKIESRKVLQGLMAKGRG